MKDKLIREILPLVAKPVRYTGNELNMIKKSWSDSKCRMVLAFPDVYEVGMSHVGSKILYGLINEKTDHLLERSFAPWPDMEALLRSKQLPLYSLESFKPLGDFEVVGFSLQYELSITNCINMMDMAGIPVCSKDRGENAPIVIAGGPVAFNPEPFADFFDAFLIGDGEEVLPEFLDLCFATRNQPRAERLLAMAKITGVYIPALYQAKYLENGFFKELVPLNAGVPARIRKRVVTDFDQAYFPAKPIVPYMNLIHDRAVLEVMRGCQRGCRFCHAGIVYRPVREKKVSTLRRQAEEQIKSSGYEEVSLSSLSSLDYSGIKSLVKKLVEDYGSCGIGVSLPSLRVDAFSVDLANEVQKVRKTTLTLAPEAGTQRMRNIINKNITEEQLMEAVQAAFKSGWNAVKLYFMFGLPYEKEEDLGGIIRMLKEVKATGNRYSRRPVGIKAGIANYVPKAHTPFQWHRQNSPEEFENKRQFLLKAKGKDKSIKLDFHDSRTSYLEGVIARGDRRLAPAILKAWQYGCKFDGWTEYFQFDKWCEALADSKIDPEFYTLRDREKNEVFPWDFIDIGVSRDFLWREYEMAVQEKATFDCRQDGCNDCGICSEFGISMEIEEDVQ
ncbi:MAG TPA: TIGR03960 family B12-binding radical SAM protein [Syntrophomonadaceae bacterium]|nr:TIGR03960 family B12-binding radical SAM protein [Syntrophomonadaceae bacterium]HPR92469.1 TIGR03960 family B12-binding radical SAM protein [Syntrophomonadaceae bacterium]